MVTKNLHWVSGESRMTSASPVFGEHRMTLGGPGLHANCVLMQIRNSPVPKIMCWICLVLHFILYGVIISTGCGFFVVYLMPTHAVFMLCWYKFTVSHKSSNWQKIIHWKWERVRMTFSNEFHYFATDTWIGHHFLPFWNANF